MSNGFDRRDFLKKAGVLAGAGMVIKASTLSAIVTRPGATPAPIQAKPLQTVRVGFVGVGGQGTGHLRNYLGIEGVEIKAICDINSENLERAQKLVVEAGQPKPEGYGKGPTDWKRLCDRKDLDLVFNATPWEWHVPVCVDAMNKGKHAVTEVPAATSLDGCWELVETSERTGKHCIMMENCCYGEPELMYLNMIRKGLLGIPIHAQCGYCHDLREIKFSGVGEGTWRLNHAVSNNGNLYPTHGLGPVAEYMNINRGDQFDFLISMSNKSMGLNLYAAEHFGPDSPQARQTYALGDVNTTLIRTMNGATIIVIHDCDSPRPYDRYNQIQGTKGILEGYPDRIYVEGKSEPHTWDAVDKWSEYKHKLVSDVGDKAKDSNHGGMDFIEDYRLIEALRTGRYPDYDVYDAAAWSAVTELSETSVANRSRPVDFPDFTRGAWKTNKPIFVSDY